MGKNPYVYAQAYLGKGEGSILINVARAVLMAFRPLTDYDGMQADHIDSNMARNVLSNLQWKSRAANNARLHTRRLKSKNHHHERHPDTIIRATKGKEVLEAKNGNRMAKMLGCSSVLIYRVLDPDDYAKTAKGWSLERLEMV